MAYSTVDDVKDVLSGAPSSTVSDASAVDLTLEQITREIENADAQINAVLSVRYDTPFVSPPPTIISMLSTDIAAYLCDLVYRMFHEYASDRNPLLLRYQRAKELLNKLANGEASLGGGGGTEEEQGVFVVNPYYGDLLYPEHIFEYDRGLPNAW